MDLKTLSTAELNQLIAQAIKERGARPEPFAGKPPETLDCTNLHAWDTQRLMDGATLFRFCMVGAGWMGLRIAPKDRSSLIGLWTTQALDAVMEAATTAAAAEGDSVPRTNKAH